MCHTHQKKKEHPAPSSPKELCVFVCVCARVRGVGMVGLRPNLHECATNKTKKCVALEGVVWKAVVTDGKKKKFHTWRARVRVRSVCIQLKICAISFFAIFWPFFGQPSQNKPHRSALGYGSLLEQPYLPLHFLSPMSTPPFTHALTWMFWTAPHPCPHENKMSCLKDGIGSMELFVVVF